MEFPNPLSASNCSTLWSKTGTVYSTVVHVIPGPVVCGNPEKPDIKEIPEIPESVDEFEGVGEGVALLVPEDVWICCHEKR